MDPDADTIIYTPVGNKIHTIVKDMLKNVADHNYEIYIMDGGTDDRKGTSNRECESEMTKHSEEARTKNPENPKRCIFISSLMGTRSWSNKYVKNVILLYNNGSFDTNSQRIARGFTPWTEHSNCTIFDFRMTYDSPTILEEYLVGMLENKQDFSGDKIECKIEKIIESSDKISFFNFYKDLKSPFKELTKDEIIKMIKCNISFRRTRLINNIVIDDIAVPRNDINYKMISAITSTNIKGDSEKVIKKNLSVEAKNLAKGKTSQKEIDEIMLKIKYIDFVNNYGYIFNFDSFKENVLNQICEHIDEYRVLNTISPLKDVDGLTDVNAGKLACGKPGLISCTPYGVIKLLKYYNIELSGKHVVIVGRSNLVGKPLISLFLMENATVTCCHSKTTDLKHYTLDADILVVAVGKPKLITADMVKDGTVVVDVGINRLESGLCGDVDFENVKSKASYITPVPGGVGAMTVAMLYNNLVETSIKKLKKI